MTTSYDVFAWVDSLVPTRFRSKIERRGDCLVWTAAKCPKGYGVFKHKKKTFRAHRLAFEWFWGRISKAEVLMHQCDNPSCVNPMHLREGTRSDNNRDMLEKRRHQHGSSHAHAKLTEDIVRAARNRHAAGELLAPMAAEYSVSVPTLWYAVVGKTWAHVPREAHGE